MLPLLLRELGTEVWPGAPVSWLVSAYALGAATIPFAVSLRFPRLPSAPLALGALATLGGLALAFALTPPFWLAVVLRALAGGASGVLGYAALGWAARHGSGAVTAQTAGFLLALVLGPAAGALLADRTGVTVPYLAIAAMAMLLCVAGLARARREGDEHANSEPPHAAHRLLRERPLRRLLLASVLIGGGVAGPVTLFPTALGDPLGAGLDLEGRALVYLLAGIGPLLALPLGRPVLARFGQTEVARAGAVVLGISLALLPLAASSFELAAIGLGGAMLLETLRRSALQAISASLPRASDRARFLALRSLCVQIGIALGVQLSFALYASGDLIIATSVGAILAASSALLVPRMR